MGKGQDPVEGDIRTSDDIRFHVGYHFSVHKSALLCLGSRKLGTTMETPDPAGIPPEWVANLEQALQSDPDPSSLTFRAIHTFSGARSN